MNARLASIAAFICGVTLATPAMAGTVAHLPAEHKAGSVSFITGGVGAREARAMKSAEGRYELALEFVRKATPRDEYLAAIPVKVKNQSGKLVLDTQSDGPFLLADLPAGKYTVVADYDGHRMTRTAQIAPGHHRHLVFAWS